MAIYQGNKKLAYACNVDNSAYSVPVGTILSYASTTPPVGFLVCDGSEVSKTLYADLYGVIGDTYGTTADTSKFKLPDLRETVPVGIGQNTTQSITNHDVHTLGQFKDDNVNTLVYADNNKNFPLIIKTNSASREKHVGMIISTEAAGNESSFLVGTGGSGCTHGKQLGVNYIIKALKVSDKYTDTPKDIYSTDEVVTDKVWIDGKPIYRKVVTQTITTAGDLNVIDGFDTSLTNTIISIYGSVKQPSGNITPISYYNTAEDGAFIYMSKSHNRFILNANTCGIGDVVLIVEYTKTND